MKKTISDFVLEISNNAESNKKTWDELYQLYNLIKNNPKSFKVYAEKNNIDIESEAGLNSLKFWTGLMTQMTKGA